MEIEKDGLNLFVVERATYSTDKDLELNKREFFIPEVGSLPVGNIKEIFNFLISHGVMIDGLYLKDRLSGDQIIKFDKVSETLKQL